MREKNQKRTGRSRRDDGKNVRYGDRERRSERRRETKGFREKEEGRRRGGVNAGRFRRERVRKAYVREGVGMSGRDGMKSSAKRPLRRNFGEDASYREESYKTRINRRPYGERHRNDRSYESRPDRSDRTYTKEKFLKKTKGNPFDRGRGDYEYYDYGTRSFKHSRKRNLPSSAGKGESFVKLNEADKQLLRERHYSKKKQEEHKRKSLDLTDEVRLNRYLSMSGICSRREADEMIAAGRVKVNGTVVTELGIKVKLGDEVEVDGNRIFPERKVYILLNKPKDYVTTMDDPLERKTVMSLLEGACKERIYPVGRLDRQTTGLLLLTNDGELTKKLTHPKYDRKKIYQVSLERRLDLSDMQQIRNGIELEDGFINADDIGYVSDDGKEIGLEIHSGRNRIVRRIFEHLGYKIVKLDRVYFAGLTKKNLPRGEWRFLTQEEVNILKYY